MPIIRKGFGHFVALAKCMQEREEWGEAINYWDKASRIVRSITKRNEFYRNIEFCRQKQRDRGEEG